MGDPLLASENLSPPLEPKIRDHKKVPCQKKEEIVGFFWNKSFLFFQGKTRPYFVKHEFFKLSYWL